MERDLHTDAGVGTATKGMVIVLVLMSDLSTTIKKMMRYFPELFLLIQFKLRAGVSDAFVCGVVDGSAV
ncbi:hypothetical protein E2562_012494 [Oryza meyeriana var. granulata]|uniref:Uncharacterized protein n=1 Tax=Oryza meyeriana var. granulata TaxID=110450 RepID=A0A6G1BW56_9ORYZ|nr:hypothetical protein E2562_012494 [Oryza meyeriana var. granulata]